MRLKPGYCDKEGLFSANFFLADMISSAGSNRKSLVSSKCHDNCQLAVSEVKYLTVLINEM